MTTPAILLSLVCLMLDQSLRVRRDLISAIGLEVAGMGVAVAGPYALKLLIDRSGSGTVSTAGLVALVAAIVLGMATNVTSALRSVHVQHVVDAMQARLVESVLRSRLSLAGLARDAERRAPSGSLERLPYSLQIVADGILWRALPIGLQALLCLILIGATTPAVYAVLSGLVLATYGLATWAGTRRHRARADAANAAAGRVSATIGDVLRNAARVVHNGAAGLELDLIAAQQQDRRTANDAMNRSLVRLSVAQFAAIGAGLSILLIRGGLDVEAGRMSVGDFVLIQAMVTRLLLPLSGFGFIMSQAGVAISTIRDILEEARLAPLPNAPDLPPGGPAAIRVDGICFSYQPALLGSSDLSQVSFDLPAGGMVALVGPNGSGKSTLARLIAGALEPKTGRILIGGRDIATVAPDWRHRHVLYVPQFARPLNRTLGENGLYPPTTQSADELVRLLTDWNFHAGNEAIDLDRMVGDQGDRLSGGQLQKLELARLAGIEVPVLLLDESSSALDPFAEARALADLGGRTAGCTTLVVISHRRRVAAMADRVVYLEGGRVQAVDRHARLMETQVGYRRFWAHDERDRDT